MDGERIGARARMGGDAALSRAGKGLIGILEVNRKADAAIYRDHGDSPKNPSMDH